MDTDGDWVFFFEDCDDTNASIGYHFDIDADEPFDASNPILLGEIWTMTQTSVSSDFWFTRSEDEEDAYAFSFFPFKDGTVYGHKKPAHNMGLERVGLCRDLTQQKRLSDLLILKRFPVPRLAHFRLP